MVQALITAEYVKIFVASRGPRPDIARDKYIFKNHELLYKVVGKPLYITLPLSMYG